MVDTTSYDLESFVNDLNICFKKFEDVANGDIIPLIFTPWDLKKISEIEGLDINRDDFICLSNGLLLGIKEWKKRPQSFLNIKALEYQKTVNC